MNKYKKLENAFITLLKDSPEEYASEILKDYARQGNTIAFRDAKDRGYDYNLINNWDDYKALKDSFNPNSNNPNSNFASDYVDPLVGTYDLDKYVPNGKIAFESANVMYPNESISSLMDQLNEREGINISPEGGIGKSWDYAQALENSPDMIMAGRYPATTDYMEQIYKKLNSDSPEDPLALGVKDMVENYGYDPNLITSRNSALNVLDDSEDLISDPYFLDFPSDYDYGPAAESAQMFETGGVPRIGNSDYTIDDLRLQGMSEDDILALLRKLSAKGYNI